MSYSKQHEGVWWGNIYILLQYNVHTEIHHPHPVRPNMWVELFSSADFYRWLNSVVSSSNSLKIAKKLSFSVKRLMEQRRSKSWSQWNKRKIYVVLRLHSENVPRTTLKKQHYEQFFHRSFNQYWIRSRQWWWWIIYGYGDKVWWWGINYVEEELAMAKRDTLWW